jgi:hypothetical protein
MKKIRRFNSKWSLVACIFWALASFPYWFFFGDPAIDWFEEKIKKHAYWEYPS